VAGNGCGKECRNKSRVLMASKREKFYPRNEEVVSEKNQDDRIHKNDKNSIKNLKNINF
jgi:hypothetical protein